MQAHNHDHTVQDQPHHRHLALLLQGGLILALCMFFASMVPGVLVTATLSSLLSMASFLVGAVALLRVEPLTLRTLNHWDVAMALMALSILAGWFVDPEAIRSFAEAQGLVGQAGAG